MWTVRSAVFLSGGHVVDGDDVPGMLKRQHSILLKLSKDLAERGHDMDSVVQRAIADANVLGLEAAVRWEAVSPAEHESARRHPANPDPTLQILPMRKRS